MPKLTRISTALALCAYCFDDDVAVLFSDANWAPRPSLTTSCTYMDDSSSGREEEWRLSLAPRWPLAAEKGLLVISQKPYVMDCLPSSRCHWTIMMKCWRPYESTLACKHTPITPWTTYRHGLTLENMAFLMVSTCHPTRYTASRHLCVDEQASELMMWRPTA